jgi:[ribosomal protein S5]-alanine N-acetyltransferase
MKLETNRLIIREYEADDKAVLIENINDEEVTKFLRKVPYPYTKKDADWYLNHTKEQQSEKPRQDFGFAIELKETKEFIGSIGVHEISEFDGTATIGYWLGKKYHRNGYMYEAAKETIRFCFEDLGLRRIDIEADLKNEASNGLIKKLGFQYEGMRRQYRRNKSNNWTPDCNQYGLLKEEWETFK